MVDKKEIEVLPRNATNEETYQFLLRAQAAGADVRFQEDKMWIVPDCIDGCEEVEENIPPEIHAKILAGACSAGHRR